MADVSAVDAGRESRSGGAARYRVGAGAFLLTVVGSNIALGAFLWFAMDARFSSMESRFESRFANIEARLTSIELRLTSIESRLTGIESGLFNIESILPSGAEAKRETVEP